MQLNTPRDGRISLDATKPFVEKQDVPPGATQTLAYTITGPDNYVIGVEEGTPVACEFRDEDGNKLDGSTRVIIQKCDRQGNPLGSEIVFSELLSRFDYSEMRTDPDFFRRTSSDLMIDEHEIVKVFVKIPQRGSAFSAEQSVLTIGDATSDFGKPVEIVHHSELSDQQLSKIKAASQASSQSTSMGQMAGNGGGQ
jgi:hypothetical protein